MSSRYLGRCGHTAAITRTGGGGSGVGFALAPLAQSRPLLVLLLLLLAQLLTLLASSLLGSLTSARLGFLARLVLGGSRTPSRLGLLLASLFLGFGLATSLGLSFGPATRFGLLSLLLPRGDARLESRKLGSGGGLAFLFETHLLELAFVRSERALAHLLCLRIGKLSSVASSWRK